MKEGKEERREKFSKIPSQRNLTLTFLFTMKEIICMSHEIFLGIYMNNNAVETTFQSIL
jgi:hypothetical protein